MSGVTTATILAGAAVAATIYNGQQQASAAKDAQRQAQVNADKQLKEQQEATNRANQKSPDTMAILDQASQAGKGGASGTMLTGAQGIDPNLLTLGKNTLLGG